MQVADVTRLISIWRVLLFLQSTEDDLRKAFENCDGMADVSIPLKPGKLLFCTLDTVFYIITLFRDYVNQNNSNL